jgi:ATP-dependent helicase HrpB
MIKRTPAPPPVMCFVSADDGADWPALPVDDVLPQLQAALAQGTRAVVVAPPGAGKTTRIPLALLGAPWCNDGLIILLEPRRLAARAAAHHMASLLGQEVGDSVGYAMRLDSRQSKNTRILVVTEGVFARMILDDPELSGVAAVLFDEFHERSLDADFGLALALETSSALRSDLRLLVMSATIDGARVAGLLGDCPVIQSQGRSFPVEIIHRDRAGTEPLDAAMAGAVHHALANHPGSILAFLPGMADIRRLHRRLEGGLPADVDLLQLHGQLDAAAQDSAIRPAQPGRRKIVLATSIAETSITIDGVTTVIDSGYARQPVFEPATGLTRLETIRVSKASADQRAGRAGRTAPGVAIRLWREAQTASFQPFAPPEIMAADLTGLVLDSLAWGVIDPRNLPFLDPPPDAALHEARATLRMLGALDEAGALTATGRAMRMLALPARLAAMVVSARPDQRLLAAMLAVLLTEQGLGGNSADLQSRLVEWQRDRSPRAGAARGLAQALAGIKGNAGRARLATEDAGAVLYAGFPDRVAMRRGQPGRFVMANGRGAMIEPLDALAAQPFLVIADVTGQAQSAQIRAAAAISEVELRRHAANRIHGHDEASFDPASGALKARRVESLDAITLSSNPVKLPVGEATNDALIRAIGESGLAVLPWGKPSQAVRVRLGWLHEGIGAPWPDVSDAHLLETLDTWLRPFLDGRGSLVCLSDGTLANALMTLVPWQLHKELDRLAPTHLDVPSGSRLPLRYEADGPVLSVRVQELFGLTVHPAIADGTVPVTLELLSPAHRPIQTTRDLPGFWQGSWRDVRTDMRGRYPRHVWPEDPANAVATHRAKPRGT